MDRRSVLLASLLILGCAREAVLETTPTFELEEDLQSAMLRARVTSRLVLIYFYSPTCDYCDAMNTSFLSDEVQPLLKGFVTVGVNVDTSQFAREAKISIVPTLVGIAPDSKGGEPVSSFEGNMTPAQLKAFIEMTKVRGDAWVRANAPEEPSTNTAHD